MSDKLNITEFEQLLQDHLSTAEVPAPSGVWDGMADALEQLNSELQFDHQLQDQLQEAQVEAPTEIWQAVQQSVAVQSGGLLSSMAAKWILGIGASAVITTGVLVYTGSGIAEREQSLQEQVFQGQLKPNAHQEEEPFKQVPQTKEAEAELAETLNEPKANSVSQPKSRSAQSEGSTPSSNSKATPAQSNSTRSASNQLPVSNGRGSIPLNGNNSTLQSAQNQSLYFILSSLNEDTSVCDGTRFELQVREGNFTQVQVRLDQQLVKSLSSPGRVIFSELEPGIHHIQFTAVKGEELINRNLRLRVNEKPKAELFVEDYGKGKYVFSMNLASAMNYAWYLDGQYSGLGNFWEYQFRDYVEQKHRVVLAMKTAQGCRDSVVKEFTNASIIQLQEPKLYNLFTPNGDGYGDVFQLDVSGQTHWKLTVYNAQKAKVFESEDPNIGWDGKNQFNGAACAEGQYYCVLTYALHGQKMKTEQWYLTLMR